MAENGSEENRYMDLPRISYSKALYDAINRNGFEVQTDMLIEEMSELTQALLKYRRARKEPGSAKKEIDQIDKEIGDVLVMLSVFLYMNGGYTEVQENMDTKVDCLKSGQ